MEELIKTLIQGQVTTTGLLLFVITCLLKGWVVPFWQIKEMKDKLAAYEEKAPNLIAEVQKLIEIQKEENDLRKEENDLRKERGDIFRTVRTNPRTKRTNMPLKKEDT